MDIVLTVVLCIVGIVVGALVAWNLANGKTNAKVIEANQKVRDAESRATQIEAEASRNAETQKKESILSAKEEILKLKQAQEAENRARKGELRDLESRIMQREESLDRRNDALDRKEHQLSENQSQLDRRRNDVEKLVAQQSTELERIAALTKDEAHEELLERVRKDTVREEAQILRESEQRTRATAEKTAREIISTAIQRCAADQASEITVTTVHIPSDDLKGRIIGREGRNIRSFEQISGVTLVIDDTPESVGLSSYDPVRRETARVALENLVADGRIHPARIEEMYAKAEKLVNQRVLDAGEQAAFDLGIHDLHPELVRTLGALRYRTSYGQNVLQHSKQVAELCSLMAAELGSDPAMAKRAGLLHDIGKAIDREVEGPHAVIGADLARKYGEKPEILHAIEAHHADIEPETVLDVLVQAADAISAARPGARRESAEAYIKRLEKLEEISNAHEGVERTYAMQAGRELHVMVEPEKISDAEAVVLAHDIAKQIEDEMEYPGQVRVVVIRESRAIDVAK